MKKITFSILACLLLANAANAQRITSMTVAGQPSLVPFAAFNPTNNSDAALGDGQIVFPASANVGNMTVSLNIGTEATLDTQLPTDWTNTVTGVKITSTVSPFNWAKYNITAKKIVPATLPFELKTGTGFSSDSWTSSTVGWAGACIDKAQTLIRFGSANRSFVVAFTDAPDSLYYTIKALGTWTGSGNVFDVDGSTDGITWTSVNKYDASNVMPGSSPAVVAKIKIANPSYRYIRWIYTTRVTGTGAFNVSLENVKVTKSPTLGAWSPEDLKVKVAICSGTCDLKLDGAEQVRDISVYDVTGNLLCSQKNPGSTVNIPNLRAGVYVAKLNLNSGNCLSTKLIKK